MITFKQYLRESDTEYRGGTRTAVVSATALISWVETHAMGYLKGKNLIYRGVDQTGFRLGDPTKGEPRVSANAANNYTIWMDNNPAFKGTPRRSRSFICSTDPHKAHGFGEVHIVIPEDSAKVGIVGKQDLWDVDVIQNIDINALNSITEHVFHKLGLGTQKTYEDLVRALKDVTLTELEEKIPEFRLPMMKTIVEEMVKRKCQNLFDLWEKVVTPDLFKYSTGKEISSFSGRSEVWIEGTCAFIPLDVESVPKAERRKFYDWVEEHALTLRRELYAQWATDLGG